MTHERHNTTSQRIPLLSSDNANAYAVSVDVLLRTKVVVYACEKEKQKLSEVIFSKPFSGGAVLLFFSFNPLRPNSDLSQTSHCNIKGLSVSEVMNTITEVQFY